MEYSSAVDPQLIGGFVVNVDNERLDASVRQQLQQMRSASDSVIRPKAESPTKKTTKLNNKSGRDGGHKPKSPIQ